MSYIDVGSLEKKVPGDLDLTEVGGMVKWRPIVSQATVDINALKFHRTEVRHSGCRQSR